MASYNRIVLVGNLTRDPELSYTPQNTPVCKFGLATNRKWKDRDGNSRDDTCFVDCTAFGRSGETLNQYMSKGRQILVEGRLQFSQWTTPEGVKRSKHEVVVDNFTFLGSGRGGEGGGGGERGAAPSAHEDSGTAAAASGHDNAAPPPPTNDSIPF